MVTGFGKTSKTANATLAAWMQLQAHDVQRLDAQLAKAGLPVIKP